MRHPSSRNQRRLIKKLKSKLEGSQDRAGHVNKLLLEEKEIIDDLRSQSQKTVKDPDN